MVDVIVEFEYIANEDDELTIKVGEIITDVNKMEGGWWEGSLNGKRGMFPDNFVKEIKKDKPRDPAPTPTKKTGSNVANLAKNLGQGVLKIGKPPSQVKEEKPAVKKIYAKVTYQYIPQHEDELGIEVGDKVEVTKQEEEGWWEGVINGKTGVFPSNFVELITEESTSSDEVEKTDKEKEENHQIKGKKVMGVGLGDIFGGGPIKLRSRDDVDVKSPDRSEPKVKKLPNPPNPVKEQNSVVKEPLMVGEPSSAGAQPLVAVKGPPALPPKEQKEAKPDFDDSSIEVGANRNKDVLFFNMTGDSMMVYDVDSYASPDRSELYITIEDSSKQEISYVVEEVEETSECSEYGTPANEVPEDYDYDDDSFLSDESTESATMANFSKVWNDDDIPLEMSTLSQARQTPPPKQSFLRRRKSRGSTRDSPAPPCHSTPCQFNQSQDTAALHKPEENEMPLMTHDVKNIQKESFLIDSLMLDKEFGDNRHMKSIEMISALPELDTGKIVDSVKLTKTRLSLPSGMEVPPYMYQIAHVNMVFEDELAEDSYRMKAANTDDLDSRQSLSNPVLIDDPKFASLPRKFESDRKEWNPYEEKCATLPADFPDYGTEASTSKTNARKSSARRSTSFKTITRHLSMLNPRLILKKFSMNNLKHKEAKHDSEVNPDEPETYIQYLFRHDRVPPVIIRMMEKYQIYPGGRMDLGYSWDYKVHLANNVIHREQSDERNDISPQAVTELEAPPAPPPKRRFFPKRAKSEVKEHRKPFFKVKRTATSVHAGPKTDLEVLSNNVDEVEKDKSIMSDDTETVLISEQPSRKPRKMSSIFRVFSSIRRTRSKRSKYEISSAYPALDQQNVVDSKADDLSTKSLLNDSDRTSSTQASEVNGEEIPTKEQHSITDISLASFAATAPADMPFDVLEAKFNEFIGLLNAEKNSYLGVEQPSYSQYSSQRCSFATTEGGTSQYDDSQRLADVPETSVYENREYQDPCQDISETDKATNTGDFEEFLNTNQSANPYEGSPKCFISEVLDAFENFIIDVSKDPIVEEQGEDPEPLSPVYLEASPPNQECISGQDHDQDREQYQPDHRYDDYRCAIMNQANKVYSYSSGQDQYGSGDKLYDNDNYEIRVKNINQGYGNQNQDNRGYYKAEVPRMITDDYIRHIDQDQSRQDPPVQDYNAYDDYRQAIMNSQKESRSPPDSSYSTVYDRCDIEAGYSHVSTPYQALANTSASSNDASYSFGSQPAAFHRIYKSHSQSCTPERRSNLRHRVASHNGSSMDSFYDRDDEELPLLYSQSLPLDSSGHRWARCVDPNTCPTQKNTEDDMQVQDLSMSSLGNNNMSFNYSRNEDSALQTSVSGSPRDDQQEANQSMVLENISFNLMDDIGQLLPGLSPNRAHQEPSYDVLPEILPNVDVLPEREPSFDVLPERLDQSVDPYDVKPSYDELDDDLEDLQPGYRSYQHGDSALDEETFPYDEDSYLSNESSPDIGQLINNTTQNAQQYFYTLGGISPQQSPLVRDQNTESETVHHGTIV